MHQASRNAIDTGSIAHAKARIISLGPRKLFDCQRPPAPACSGPAIPEGWLESKNVVELIGIEPTTSGLQSPRSPS